MRNDVDGTARRLTPAERLVRVADEGYTMGFTTYARVLGAVDAARLRRALDAVARRHPLLSARVDGDWLRPGGAAPIELIEAAASVDEAHAIVEGELVHRRWPADGPRARCVAVRHRGGATTIALTFDHLVSDGSSGVIALRDLLAAIDAPDALGAPLLSPGQNAFFPEGRGGARDFFRALSHAQAQDVRPRPLRLGSMEDVPPDRRRTRVRVLRFSRDATAAIARAARRGGATVHGALVAACVLGIADVTEGAGERPIRVMHPVDFRRYLPSAGGTRPIGDAVGYYVTSVETDHRVRAGTAPESLAAEVTAAVRAAKDAGEPFLTAPSGARVLVLARALLGAERFRPFAERALLQGTFSITNLGELERLGLAARFGGLEVEEAGFLASPSIFGSFCASACTFGGSLALALHPVEPRMTAERAGAIGDAILARLEAFASTEERVAVTG